MDLFGIGGAEVLVILLVALLVLGPNKVVGVGKTLGKITRTLKKTSFDLTTQITKELELDEKQTPSHPKKKD